jgi:hypothetical protein
LSVHRRRAEDPPSAVGCLGYPPVMARQLPLSAVAVINLRADGVSKLASMKQAADVCGLLWALANTTHKFGHYPTQAEYAAEWKVSERTAQREWALFKRAFPSEESPERLARWLLSEASRKIDDASSALSVAAPADLVPA